MLNGLVPVVQDVHLPVERPGWDDNVVPSGVHHSNLEDSDCGSIRWPADVDGGIPPRVKVKRVAELCDGGDHGVLTDHELVRSDSGNTDFLVGPDGDLGRRINPGSEFFDLLIMIDSSGHRDANSVIDEVAADVHLYVVLSQVDPGQVEGHVQLRENHQFEP